MMNPMMSLKTSPQIRKKGNKLNKPNHLNISPGVIIYLIVVIKQQLNTTYDTNDFTIRSINV